MKNFKIAILIIAALFISVGCKEAKDGADGETKIVYLYPEYTTRPADGFGHKGLPEFGGLARGAGVDPTNDLDPTGNTYLYYIANDEGKYNFGNIPDQYIYLFIQANFHDEIRGTVGDTMNLHSYVDLDSGENNANILTTIESPCFEKLFKIDYSALPMPTRWTTSKAECKTRVLNFFNMPVAPGEDLSDGDVSGDTQMDRITQGVSAMMLQARSTTGQLASLAASIGSSLAASPTGNTTLKDEVLTLAQNIDIVQTNRNIESKFNEIGATGKKANKWYNYIDSDYDGIRNDEDQDSYIEMITETHEIKGWSRIADTCNLSFGTTDQRFFANPRIFDSSITAAKYFTSNFDSQYMSIYSVDDHGTVDTSDDTPDAPLAVFDGATYVSKVPYNYLQEQYLDASDDSYSVPQAFTAVITGHSIPVGVNVYVVFWSDSGYRPMGLCQSGEFLQFSRNQYSADGVSWLGAAPQSLDPVYGRYNLLKGAWLD